MNVISDAPGAAPAEAEPRSTELRAHLGDDIVLITGFPGARARALLEVLLAREPELHVWLVVPESELDASAQLLAAHVGAHERLRLVPGEPSAIDLGLSRQVYAELALHVDRWFSLYQTSDAQVSRELSTRVNLGAARELIEFSRVAERLTHVTFLSSSCVFGDRHGAVGEEELSIGQSFPSHAARTLATAEAMLRRSLADVPVSIVRAPHVLGARRQSAPLRASALHRLLALVANAPADAALPLPPGANRPVQVLPADFLAEALYAVSVLGTRGHTYHFSDPDPPALAEVLERAATYFGKRLEPGGGARALGRLLRSPGFWLSQQSSRALSAWVDAPELLTRGGDRLLERAGLRAPSLLGYLDGVLSETTQLLEAGGSLEPSAERPIEVVA